MSREDEVFEIIRREWKAAAPQLAAWAMEHMVNRKDVWGQYTTPTEKEKLNSGKSYKALTLPQKAMRGKDMVTLDKLTRHFRSSSVKHLIGLHAAHPDNTAKWLALDIDLHEPAAVGAEDTARRNFAAASAWWEELQAAGHDPLLLDSNGAGGFHLLVLFAKPAPLADVHAMGQALRASWKEKNIDGPPEQFPQSAKLAGDKLGAWLRLFGMHHTHRHFTRVWSGDPWLDEPWLEGSAAIETILSVRPGPPPVPRTGGAEPVEAASVTRQPGRFQRKPGKKPRICVDLDGVLARYEGWAGREAIGDPLPGALEFIQALREFAEVIIHTSRADQTAGMESVASWLEKHAIPHDAIHTGPGKPKAMAYVDDRSVACRPQDFGPAVYAVAEHQVRVLCQEREPSLEDSSEARLARLIAAWPFLTEDQQRAVAAIAGETEPGK